MKKLSGIGNQTDKYLDFTRELKSLWNMRMAMMPVVIVPQRLGRKTRGIENQKKNEDYPEDSIFEIGQKTQKRPGDMLLHRF